MHRACALTKANLSSLNDPQEDDHDRTAMRWDYAWPHGWFST